MNRAAKPTWLLALLLATGGCTALQLKADTPYLLFPTDGPGVGPKDAVIVTAGENKSRVCFPKRPGKFLIFPLGDVQQCGPHGCRPCGKGACELLARPLTGGEEQCEDLRAEDVPKASHYLVVEAGSPMRGSPEQLVPQLIIPHNDVGVNFIGSHIVATARPALVCPQCYTCPTCMPWVPPPPPPIPRFLESRAGLIEIHQLGEIIPAPTTGPGPTGPGPTSPTDPYRPKR